MDFDITWNNPTTSQLAALTYVYRNVYGRSIPDSTLSHAQLVQIESKGKVLAVETGNTYTLCPYDWAEMMCLAEKSLWYTQAVRWNQGHVPFKEKFGTGADRVFELAGRAITSIVEWGYQNETWWDTVSIWDDVNIRTLNLAAIVEVSFLVQELAAHSLWVTSAWFYKLPKLVVPGINLRKVAQILKQRTPQSGVALLEFVRACIDPDFAHKLCAIERQARKDSHHTYTPTTCICPECNNLVAPTGVRPRDGHFKNYRRTGACQKGHNGYFCEKCQRPHNYVSKVGLSHIKHRQLP